MLALGVWSGAWLQPDLFSCIFFSILLLVLVACSLKGIMQSMFWALAGLTMSGLGMWSMAATLPENQPDHYLNHLHLEVQWLEIRVLEPLKTGKFSEKYIGEIRRVDAQSTRGKVLLEIRKDSTRGLLTPGQIIHTPALPEAIPQPKNPGAFDYGQYLKNQGIHTRLKLTPSNCLLAPMSASASAKPLLSLKKKLYEALEDLGLGREETQIARALLLGDRTAINPELRLSYTRAGILHVLAISGLHVGILATFLFAILSPLRHMTYGKTVQVLLGLSVLWGYALLAGFTPSVVRAVLLYSFVALALYLERPGQTLHFLGLCWVFMLAAVNPNWLLQTGFQLSFAAVAAIVVFYPFFYRYMPLKKKPWGYFGKLMAVSLAAQAGTLPFTLYYFHQFPGLFLLSNLVLLPGLGLLLVYGLISLTLESFVDLPRAATLILDGLLRGMNRYTDWASHQSAFFLEGIVMTRAECISSATAVFLLGLYLKTRWHKTLYGAGVLMLLFQGMGIYQEVQSSKMERWVIPHQVAHTMLWKHRGSDLEVASTDSLKGSYLVHNIRQHWGIRHIKYSPLEYGYQTGGLSLTVLDQNGLYSPGDPRPDYLLLSGSPRIHLGRVLEVLNPRAVIADGSNYTRDLERWKKSCGDRGIAFHATAESGAFEIKISPK